MASNLVIEKGLATTAQPVMDENGKISPLALSTDSIGIGTTNPKTPLHVAHKIPVLTLQDIDSTGSLHTGYISLRDNSNAEKGWVGFGSSSTPHLYLGNNYSDGHTILRTANRDRLVVAQNGNVGIGIPAPQRSLHIHGGVCMEASELPAGLFGWQVAPRVKGEDSFLGFHEDTKPNHNGQWRMVIKKGGNVGIGIINPREKLEVNGNILATGDVRLTGADCAEEFDVEKAQALDPGTVMVIGEGDKLQQCIEAHDKRVAGVLSGAGDYKPGIVLDRQESKNKRMPLALSCKVFCKVDAQYSPINVGDLLTTSPTPGHAMKADDPAKAFGAVIGKALRPLTEGQGLIPTLVALQ